MNPCPDSAGLQLFEHWQPGAHGPYLLRVTSDRTVLEVKPGDTVVMRTWAAAGPPLIVTGEPLS